MTSGFSSLSLGALVLALVCLCFAAAVDARERRLPNILTLVILLLYPVYAATSPGDPLWLDHLGAFAVVLALGYALYDRKWLGAGDVKLLATLSLWAGPDWTPLLLLVTTITGGLLAGAIALKTFLRRRAKTDTDTTPIRALPISYGVAIATGGFCVFLMLSHQSLPQI